MRIRAEIKPFAEAAAAAARIAPSRSTIPILNNVKIAAADGHIRLIANDLDKELETRFPGAVEIPGETTLPAHTLNDALRLAPKSGEAVLETMQTGATLKIGRSRLALPTLPVGDYPSLSLAGDFAAPLDLDGKGLAADLAALSHALSREETRYYLQGVFFHGQPNEKLVMVTTDGHRMMWIEGAAQPSDISAIVPAEAVKAFADMAKSADRVQLELGTAMARLTAGPTRLVTKLIDGTYPDYARVIPQSFEQSATADAETLRQATARALLAGDVHRAVRLDFDGETLRVRARGRDGAEVEDALDVEGDAHIEVAFDGRYLNEAVAALGGAQVRFSLNDSGSPGHLHNPDRPDRIVILMPLRA